MINPFDPAEIKKEIEKIVITPECLTTEELEVFPFIPVTRWQHIDQCDSCKMAIELLVPTEEEMKWNPKRILAAIAKEHGCTPEEYEARFNLKYQEIKNTHTPECFKLYELESLHLLSKERLSHANNCAFCKPYIDFL